MNTEEDKLKESDFAKILWDYFSLHGNQRIQIMNFYIVLETFFVTAFITLFQLDGVLTVIRVIICVAIMFFSFIFHALDIRTKEMIKTAEDALKNIEHKYEDIYGKSIMIFNIEQEKTIYQRKRSWFAKKYLSYSKLFGLIFLFFTFIGLLGIGLEILNICQ